MIKWREDGDRDVDADIPTLRFSANSGMDVKEGVDLVVSALPSSE